MRRSESVDKEIKRQVQAIEATLNSRPHSFIYADNKNEWAAPHWMEPLPLRKLKNKPTSKNETHEK